MMAVFFLFWGIVMGLYSSGCKEQESLMALDEPEWKQMRMQMVDQQLRSRGIRELRVLAAMSKIPRERFVPEAYRNMAYEDGPLPIGYDQTISQPFIVAYMSELLEVNPGDRVLEIGTGSGYQAAVLAKLAGEVYTIEILEPLMRQARTVLESSGYDNIHYKIGDGWEGWPEEAPFDRIMITAAPDRIPDKLAEQLREGGVMVFPLGSQSQTLIRGVKKNGVLQTTQTIPVRFVPLVKE